jgi:Cys-rich protein (TIGR01571 family)
MASLRCHVLFLVASLAAFAAAGDDANIARDSSGSHRVETSPHGHPKVRSAKRFLSSLIQDTIGPDHDRPVAAPTSNKSALETVEAALETVEEDVVNLDGNGRPVTSATFTSKDVPVRLGGSSDDSDYYRWATIEGFNGEEYVIVREQKDDIMFYAFTALLACIAAYLYKSTRSWPSVEATDGASALTQWSSGLCDCFEDPYTCVWACCCPAVRWADTLDMVGMMKFWSAFALCTVLEFVMHLPCLGIVWVILCCVMTSYRQELRGLFQIPRAGFVVDFALICCCMPCVLAQDARHVNMAAKLGHEAVLAQQPIKDFSEAVPKAEMATATESMAGTAPAVESQTETTPA